MKTLLMTQLQCFQQMLTLVQTNKTMNDIDYEDTYMNSNISNLNLASGRGGTGSSSKMGLDNLNKQISNLNLNNNSFGAQGRIINQDGRYIHESSNSSHPNDDHSFNAQNNNINSDDDAELEKFQQRIY